jgi:hypothetical protein
MRASLGWVFVMGLAVAAPGCNKQARHRTPTGDDHAVARRDHDRDGDIDERDRDGPVDERAGDGRPDDGTNRSAVRAIASARCEREARCNNLGADAKFPSKEECFDRVRADWAKELNTYECPGGLNRAELDECLEDIRGEDCGSPFDTLARTLSCSKTEICVD